MSRVLLINGSLGGDEGNTQTLVRWFAEGLSARVLPQTVTLAKMKGDFSSVQGQVEVADGFAFFTGTYWDSWGSVLQKFLEDFSGTEATSHWIGKPAVVVVSGHSVGGKGVLSRLQGVLNNFGVLIPPLGGMVYTAVQQEALKTMTSATVRDVWQKGDLKVLAENLERALAFAREWSSWETDQSDFRAKWIED